MLSQQEYEKTVRIRETKYACLVTVLGTVKPVNRHFMPEFLGGGGRSATKRPVIGKLFI